MKHPYLTFYGAALLFIGTVVFYAYVVRGTLWSIPVAVVMLGALVIMTAAHTQNLYGQATAAKVVKVTAYTIGYNIIGWTLLWAGDAILRSPR